MFFNIYRVSTSIKKPHPKAEFTGFDDANEKHYTIQVDSLEELLAIAKHNKCEITIYPPVEKEDLWDIAVIDA